MTRLASLVLAAGLFLGLSAQARPVPELTEFTRETVTAISKALAEVQEEESRSYDEWDFKRFFLRIRAKVAFDIEAVKLELIPEIELVWQKEKEEQI